MSRRVAALRANLANGEHLDLESEIVPYIDGRLDAEAKRDVEAHTAYCEVCRVEVEELRKFASTDRGTRRRTVAAALAAAAVIAIGIAIALVMPRPVAPPQSVRVVPPPPVTQPALTASLRDGERVIGIDRSGALRGIELDATTSQRVASLLAHPELAAPPVLATLAAPARDLRGTRTEAHGIAVRSPAGIIVTAVRPQFLWSGPSNVAYRITITDNDAFALHGETRGESWAPPTDLPRGRTYTWQVSAMIDGRRVVAPVPPAPPALFRIVDERTAHAIETAPSHLIAGMLAYDAGAIADARSHFEQLAVANPSSAIPAKLIESCDRALR